MKILLDTILNTELVIKIFGGYFIVLLLIFFVVFAAAYLIIVGSTYCSNPKHCLSYYLRYYLVHYIITTVSWTRGLFSSKGKK